MRVVLLNQFDLVWRLAQTRVLSELSEDCLYWEPSPGTLTVHKTLTGWRVDWWNESGPMPDMSIAWVLWRMSWWGENTLRGIHGLEPLDPSEMVWPGSLDAASRKLDSLASRWRRVLAGYDADLVVLAPWGDRESLIKVALWANVELARDLTTIETTCRLWRNREGFAGVTQPVPRLRVLAD